MFTINILDKNSNIKLVMVVGGVEAMLDRLERFAHTDGYIVVVDSDGDVVAVVDNLD